MPRKIKSSFREWLVNSSITYSTQLMQTQKPAHTDLERCPTGVCKEGKHIYDMILFY